MQPETSRHNIMPKFLDYQRGIVTKNFGLLSCLSRVAECNFKRKLRFKTSRSSHRCSNANAKFQFFLRNTTGNCSFDAYRQLILHITIHTRTCHIIRLSKFQKERRNENQKSMTQNYLKIEKFRVIMKKEEHLQNLYLQLRSITAKFLSRQKYYIETLQAMEILLLKVLCEEDFGHELQQYLHFLAMS